MSDDSQVTAAEIARLAGVGRAAVSNWRRRHDDFPAAAGGSTTSPSFRVDEIRRWLRDQGKLDEVGLADQLWLALSAGGGERDLAAGLTLAGLALHVAPGEAPRSAAQLSELLPGRLVPLVPEQFGPADQQVVDIALGVAPTDAAELFEDLYQRFVRATSRQVAVTPTPLAELMIELSGLTGGTVFDPACGTGTLLGAAMAAAPTAEAVGQEIDVALAGLAVVRLSFLAEDPAPRITAGDSLLDDRWPDLRADAAVSNPPFGLRDWGADDLAYDARWEYGLPPRSESELAWVQHLLAHVRPGGRVVVLMPPSASSRRSGRRIRAELLRRGALRAVIALPPGAAPPSGIPLTLWVLERPSDASTRGGGSESLLVVNAAVEAVSSDWETLRASVPDIWRRHIGGEPLHLPGVAAAIPVIDLLDEEVDVTPTRHVQVPADDVRAANVTTLSATLERVMTGLAELVPTVDDAGGRGPQAMISVGDLSRTGALSVIRLVGGVSSRRGGAVEGPADVLTGRDVASGSSASGHAGSAAGALHELAPGDVVVVAAGDRVRTRVIEDAGLHLGSGLYLLRPDPDVVDSWFLAGCLRAGANARFSASLATTMRIDVRRLEVPRIPLVEQRALGTAFQRMHQLERGLDVVGRTGADLVTALTDGLASGTLRLTER